MAVFHYGIDSSIELSFVEGAAVDELGTPRTQPLADVAAATASALAAPISYPALAESMTPVDRVVLALGRSTPQAAEVTAGRGSHPGRSGR